MFGGGIGSPWFRFAAIIGPWTLGTPFKVPVSMFQTVVVPLPCVGVPSFSCPVVSRVICVPETAVISCFTYSVLLMVSSPGPIPMKFPYFAYCPTDTPGVYTAAKTGAVRATNKKNVAISQRVILELSIWRNPSFADK